MKSRKLAAWVVAGRPRTLPLSLSGIFVGAGLSMDKGIFDPYSFALCVLITLLFQLISNLANDLGDGLRGTDNEHRLGPSRAFQSGMLNQHELSFAIKVLSGVSLVAVAVLLFYAFGVARWPWIAVFAIFAVLSIWAGRKYTMGDRPYGYQGWGDVAVFAFFGLLAVLGTEFVLTLGLGLYSVYPATSMGLLSAAVLNLNNMRDIENDSRQGKNTLVVKIGARSARYYHLALIGVSLICWVVYLYFTEQPLLVYAALWPYGLISVHLLKVFRVADERELDPELKKVAISTFLISLTFIILKGAFS